MYEVNPYDAQGRVWGESLAESGLRQALNKPEAMKNLLDRHEGPVNAQPIERPDIVQTFIFVLPDGTRVQPKQLKQGEDDATEGTSED